MTAEQQTFLRVLPTRWRRIPAGIDMERNYVTVTLCISSRSHTVNLIPFHSHSQVFSLIPIPMGFQRGLFDSRLFLDSKSDLHRYSRSPVLVQFDRPCMISRVSILNRFRD